MYTACQGTRPVRWWLGSPSGCPSHDPFMPRSTSPEEGTPKPECPYAQSLLIYIVDCGGWAPPLPGKHKPPSMSQWH